MIRWWFHTNGTVTPGYDSNGMAKELTPGAMNDVVKPGQRRAHRRRGAQHQPLVVRHAAGAWQGENIPTATLTNNKNC